MDLREIEKIVKETKGGIIEKKETLIPILTPPANDVDEHGHAKPKPTKTSIDSGSALQLFLDHIPISSLNTITSSSSGKYILDTCHLLYRVRVHSKRLLQHTVLR